MTLLTKIISIGVFCAASVWAASPVRILYDENRLEEALPLCRQFEVLSTRNADNLVACSWVYFRTDRLESAQKCMELLKRGYSTTETQLLFAMELIKLKKFDSAKQVLTKFGEDYKTSPLAMVGQELYGELYEAMGQIDTAAFVYKQVVARDNRRVRAHAGLGRYYVTKKDYRHAVYHLEIVAHAWTKDVESRQQLGVVALEKENYKDALKWLGEAYRLNQADTRVLEQLGNLFEKRKRMKEAIRFWQRAFALNKESTIAKEKLTTYFSQLIEMLVDSKQFTEGLAQISTAGAILTAQPKLLLLRGVCYRGLGKYETAIKDIQTYLVTSPNDPQAHREMGIAYLNLKLSDQAQKYFLAAIDLEPKEGMNHAWLAFVLEAKNDLPSAEKEWQTALQLLKDPGELQKATRRLASIKKRLGGTRRTTTEDTEDLP